MQGCSLSYSDSSLSIPATPQACPKQKQTLKCNVGVMQSSPRSARLHCANCPALLHINCSGLHPALFCGSPPLKPPSPRFARLTTPVSCCHPYPSPQPNLHLIPSLFQASLQSPSYLAWPSHHPPSLSTCHPPHQVPPPTKYLLPCPARTSVLGRALRAGDSLKEALGVSVPGVRAGAGEGSGDLPRGVSRLTSAARESWDTSTVRGPPRLCTPAGARLLHYGPQVGGL
jgi:hypothetical protein